LRRSKPEADTAPLTSKRQLPPLEKKESDEPIRLQKLLADWGVASRRQIEAMIEAGRIQILRRTAVLGDKVTADTPIFLDGKAIKNKQPRSEVRTRVLVYHKPTGQICARTDDPTRDSVYSHLPPLPYGRWVMVGRLDVNTAGLLIFTSNGELAHRLMHPKFHIVRQYAVRILGELLPQHIKMLQQGVMLDDGPAKFDSLDLAGGEGANTWVHVTLHEGRNREVRRLFEALGFTVSRLIRLRFGDITLPRGLRRGEWLEMGPLEMNKLLRSVGLDREKLSRSSRLKERRGRE